MSRSRGACLRSMRSWLPFLAGAWLLVGISAPAAAVERLAFLCTEDRVMGELAPGRPAVFTDLCLVDVNPDTPNRRRITRKQTINAFSWAPNGHLLSFVDGNTLYAIGADGRGLEKLFTRIDGFGQRPSWSPAWQRLAFECGATFRSDICVVDMNGLNEMNLTEADMAPDGGDVTDKSPTWSPDGRRIAYQCDLELCVVDATGGPITRLGARGVGPASWSPDGSRLAYACSIKGKQQLCVIPVQVGARPKVLTTSGMVSEPRFSPGGKRIAYVAERVWTIEVGGGKPTRMSSNKSRSWQPPPTWAPDGKRITYTEFRSSAYRIYTASVDDGKRRRVTKNKLGDDYAPSWAPK